MEKKIAELVFIPSPGMGHLIPTVNMAKNLVDRNQQLFISILIINKPSDTTVNSYIHSLESDPSIKTTTPIKFIKLHSQPNISREASFFDFIDNHRPIIKDAMKHRVNNQQTQPDSPNVAGFIIDMFLSTMVDVADELGVPSYLFYTSSASILSLRLYSQSLMDDHDVNIVHEFNKPDTELDVPGYRNRIPASKVVPSTLLESKSCLRMINQTRCFRETKGITVNSFMELESRVFQSLQEDDKIPRVYPVGPVINLSQSHRSTETDLIMKWLDRQPSSSVVYLCFGSRGCFNEDQVKEIAIGLERAGYRFIWSLRRPEEVGQLSSPTEYEAEELKDIILPNGFLDRTTEIGKVIGWAPQTEILAHPSIGAFVSHCGWNSTLESLWFGVPIVTWPLFAEQQLNAFELVKELGLAVEIRTDCRWDMGSKNCNLKVTADEVEVGVKKAMEERGRGQEVRRKVKEMKEKCMLAVREGGSSYIEIGRFIEDVFNNIS